MILVLNLSNLSTNLSDLVEKKNQMNIRRCTFKVLVLKKIIFYHFARYYLCI